MPEWTLPGQIGHLLEKEVSPERVSEIQDGIYDDALKSLERRQEIFVEVPESEFKKYQESPNDVDPVLEQDGKYVRKERAFHETGQMTAAGKSYMDHVKLRTKQYANGTPVWRPDDDIVPIAQENKPNPFRHYNEAREELFWNKTTEDMQPSFDQYVEYQNEKAQKTGEIPLDSSDEDLRNAYEQMVSATKAQEEALASPDKVFKGKAWAKVNGEYQFNPQVAHDPKLVVAELKELGLPLNQEKELVDRYRDAYNQNFDYIKEDIEALQSTENAKRFLAPSINIATLGISGLKRTLDEGVDKITGKERDLMLSLESTMINGGDAFKWAMENELPADLSAFEQFGQSAVRAFAKPWQDIGFAVATQATALVQADKASESLIKASAVLSSQDEAQKNRFQKTGSFEIGSIEITTHDILDLTGQVVMYIMTAGAGAAAGAAAKGGVWLNRAKSLGRLAPLSYAHSAGGTQGAAFNQRLADAQASGQPYDESELIRESFVESIITGAVTAAVTSAFQMIAPGMEGMFVKGDKSGLLSELAKRMTVGTGRKQVVKAIGETIADKTTRRAVAKLAIEGMNVSLKSFGLGRKALSVALGIGSELLEEFTDELLGNVLSETIVDDKKFFVALNDAVDDPERLNGYLKAGLLGALGATQGMTLSGVPAAASKFKSARDSTKSAVEQAQKNLSNRASLLKAKAQSLSGLAPGQYEQALADIISQPGKKLTDDVKITPKVETPNASNLDGDVKPPVQIPNTKVMGRAKRGDIPVLDKRTGSLKVSNLRGKNVGELPVFDGDSSSSPIEVVMNKLFGAKASGGTATKPVGKVLVGESSVVKNGSPLNPKKGRVRAQEIWVQGEEKGDVPMLAGYVVKDETGGKEQYFRVDELKAAIADGTIPADNKFKAKLDNQQESSQISNVIYQKLDEGGEPVTPAVTNDTQKTGKGPEEVPAVADNRGEGSKGTGTRPSEQPTTKPVKIAPKEAPSTSKSRSGFEIERLDEIGIILEEMQMTDGSTRTVESEVSIQERSQIVDSSGFVVWTGANEDAKSALFNLTQQANEGQEVQNPQEGDETQTTEAEQIEEAEGELPIEQTSQTWREKIKKQAEESRRKIQGRTSLGFDPTLFADYVIVAVDAILDGATSFANVFKKLRETDPSITEEDARSVYDDARAKVTEAAQAEQAETPAEEATQETARKVLPLDDAESYYVNEAEIETDTAEQGVVYINRQNSAAAVGTGDVVAISDNSEEFLQVLAVTYDRDGTQRIKLQRKSVLDSDVRKNAEAKLHRKSIVDAALSYVFGAEKEVNPLNRLKKLGQKIAKELYPDQKIAFADDLKVDAAVVYDQAADTVTVNLAHLQKLVEDAGVNSIASNESNLTEKQKQYYANQVARVVATGIEEDVIHRLILQELRKDGGVLDEAGVEAFMRDAAKVPALQALIESVQKRIPSGLTPEQRKAAIAVETLTAFSQLIRSGGTFGTEHNELVEIARDALRSIGRNKTDLVGEESTILKVIGQYLTRMMRALRANMIKYGLTTQSHQMLDRLETMLDEKLRLARGVERSEIENAIAEKNAIIEEYLFGRKDQAVKGLVNIAFKQNSDGINEFKGIIRGLGIPLHIAFDVNDDGLISLDPDLMAAIKSYRLLPTDQIEEVEQYVEALNDGGAAIAFRETIFNARMLYDLAVSDLGGSLASVLDSADLSDPVFWGYERTDADRLDYLQKKNDLTRALLSILRTSRDQFNIERQLKLATLQNRTSGDLEAIRGADVVAARNGMKRIVEILSVLRSAGADTTEIEEVIGENGDVRDALLLMLTDYHGHPAFDQTFSQQNQREEISNVEKKVAAIRSKNYQDISDQKAIPQPGKQYTRKANWQKISKAYKARQKLNDAIFYGRQRLFNSQKMDTEGFGTDHQPVASQGYGGPTVFGYNYFTANQVANSQGIRDIKEGKLGRYDVARFGAPQNPTRKIIESGAGLERTPERLQQVTDALLLKEQKIRSNAAFLGRQTFREMYVGILRGDYYGEGDSLLQTGGFSIPTETDDTVSPLKDFREEMGRFKQIKLLFDLHNDFKDLDRGDTESVDAVKAKYGVNTTSSAFNKVVSKINDVLNGLDGNEGVAQYIRRIGNLIGMDVSEFADPTLVMENVPRTPYSNGTPGNPTLASKIKPLLKERLLGRNQQDGLAPMWASAVASVKGKTDKNLTVQDRAVIDEAMNNMIAAVQNLNADMKLVREATKEFLASDVRVGMEREIVQQQVAGLSTSDEASIPVADLEYSVTVANNLAVQHKIEARSQSVKVGSFYALEHMDRLSKTEYDSGGDQVLVDEPTTSRMEFRGNRNSNGQFVVRRVLDRMEDGKPVYRKVPVTGSPFNSRDLTVTESIQGFRPFREEYTWERGATGAQTNGHPTKLFLYGPSNLVVDAEGYEVNVSSTQILRGSSEKRVGRGSDFDEAQNRLDREFTGAESSDSIETSELANPDRAAFYTQKRLEFRPRKNQLEWNSQAAIAIFRGDIDKLRRFFSVLKSGRSLYSVRLIATDEGIFPEFHDLIQDIKRVMVPGQSVPITTDAHEFLKEVLAPRAERERKVLEAGRKKDSRNFRRVSDMLDRLTKSNRSPWNQNATGSELKVDLDRLSILRSSANRAAGTILSDSRVIPIKSRGRPSPFIKSLVVDTNTLIDEDRVGPLFEGLAGSFVQSVPNVSFVVDSKLPVEENGSTLELNGRLVVFLIPNQLRVPTNALGDIIGFASKNPAFAKTINDFGRNIRQAVLKTESAIFNQEGTLDEFAKMVSKRLPEDRREGFIDQVRKYAPEQLVRLYRSMIITESYLNANGRGASVLADLIGADIVNAGLDFALFQEILVNPKARDAVSVILAIGNNQEEFSTSLPEATIMQVLESSRILSATEISDDETTWGGPREERIGDEVEDDPYWDDNEHEGINRIDRSADHDPFEDLGDLDASFDTEVDDRTSAHRLANMLFEVASFSRVNEYTKETFPALNPNEYVRLKKILNDDFSLDSYYRGDTLGSPVAFDVARLVMESMEASRTAPRVTLDESQRDAKTILEASQEITPIYGTKREASGPAHLVDIGSYVSRYRGGSTSLYRNIRLNDFKATLAGGMPMLKELAAELHRGETREDRYVQTIFDLDLSDEATARRFFEELGERVGKVRVDAAIEEERAIQENAENKIARLEDIAKKIQKKISKLKTLKVSEITEQDDAHLVDQFARHMAAIFMQGENRVVKEVGDETFGYDTSPHIRGLDNVKSIAQEMFKVEVDAIRGLLHRRKGLSKTLAQVQAVASGLNRADATQQEIDASIEAAITQNTDINNQIAALDKEIAIASRDLEYSVKQAYQRVRDEHRGVTQTMQLVWNRGLNDTKPNRGTIYENQGPDALVDMKPFMKRLLPRPIDSEKQEKMDMNFPRPVSSFEEDNIHPVDLLAERDLQVVDRLRNFSIDPDATLQAFAQMMGPLTFDSLPREVRSDLIAAGVTSFQKALATEQDGSRILGFKDGKALRSFVESVLGQSGLATRSYEDLVSIIRNIAEEGFTVTTEEGTGKNTTRKDKFISPDEILSQLKKHIVKGDRDGELKIHVYKKFDDRYQQRQRQLARVQREIQKSRDEITQMPAGRTLRVVGVPTAPDEDGRPRTTTVSFRLRGDDVVRMRGFERALKDFSENWAERAYAGLKNHYGFSRDFDYDDTISKSIRLAKLKEALVKKDQKDALKALTSSDNKVGVSPFEIIQATDEGQVSRGTLTSLNAYMLDEDGTTVNLKTGASDPDRAVRLFEKFTHPETGNTVVLFPEDGYSNFRRAKKAQTGSSGTNADFNNLILYASLAGKGTSKTTHFFETGSLRAEFQAVGEDIDSPLVEVVFDDVDPKTNQTVKVRNTYSKNDIITRLMANLKAEMGPNQDDDLNTIFAAQVRDISRMMAYLQRVDKKPKTERETEIINRAMILIDTIMSSSKPGWKVGMAEEVIKNEDTGEVTVTTLSLQSVYGELFAITLGKNLMDALSAGIRTTNSPDIARFSYGMKDWTYHQHARNRAIFGANGAAYMQAIAMQHLIQDGIDGKSGRAAYKTITEQTLERLGKTQKPIKEERDQALTMILASLRGLEESVGFNNRSSKLRIHNEGESFSLAKQLHNWFMALEEGTAGLSNYSNVVNSSINKVGQLFSRNASLRRQAPITSEVFRIVNNSIGREITNGYLRAENRRKDPKGTEQLAKNLIKQLDSDLQKQLGHIRNEANAHIDNLIKEFRKLHTNQQILVSQSFDIDGKFYAPKPIQSIVPLRFVEVSSPIRQTTGMDDEYSEKIGSVVSHNSSSLYSRGFYGQKATRKGYSVVDLNMPAAIRQMIDSAVYRQQVSPTYMIFRSIFGESVKESTDNATGLIKRNTISNDAAIRKIYGDSFDKSDSLQTVRLAAHQMAKEVESNIRGELLQRSDSSDLSELVQAFGAYYVWRRLVSFSNFYLQPIVPVLGMVKNHVISKMTGQKGLNASFLKAMRLSLKDAFTGYDEVSDFVKANNVYLYYRNWDGTDNYRQTERKSFRVGSKKARTAYAVTGLVKGITAGLMELTFGKGERVITRALYLSELFNSMQRNNPSAPQTIEEMMATMGSNGTQAADLLSKAEADIKVSDMMGVFDPAKKAKVMLPPTRSEVFNEIVRTRLFFKNHMMTTSANMAASFGNLLDAESRGDQYMRADAVANIVGTMVQNTAFSLLKARFLLPLSAILYGMLQGDDDDEAVENAIDFTEDLMKQDEDDNWLQGRAKAFFFGSGDTVITPRFTDSQEGVGSAERKAKMASYVFQTMANELMSGVPVVGPALTQSPVLGDGMTGFFIPSLSDHLSGIPVDGPVNTRFDDSYRKDKFFREAANVTTLTAGAYDIAEDTRLFFDNWYDSDLPASELDYFIWSNFTRDTRSGARARVAQRGNNKKVGNEWFEYIRQDLFED